MGVPAVQDAGGQVFEEPGKIVRQPLSGQRGVILLDGNLQVAVRRNPLDQRTNQDLLTVCRTQDSQPLSGPVSTASYI